MVDSNQWIVQSQVLPTSHHRKSKKGGTTDDIKRGHLLDAQLQRLIDCVLPTTHVFAGPNQMLRADYICRALAFPRRSELLTRSRSNISCSNNQTNHARVDAFSPTAAIDWKKNLCYSMKWQFGCTRKLRSERNIRLSSCTARTEMQRPSPKSMLCISQSP